MKDERPEIAGEVALVEATVVADDLGDIADFRRLRETNAYAGLRIAVKQRRAFRHCNRRRADRIAGGGRLLLKVRHGGLILHVHAVATAEKSDNVHACCC